MSFWAQSPGPHWSDCIWSYLSCSGTPHAYPIRKVHLENPPPSKFGDVHLATQDDALEVSLFLQTYFQITKKSQCTLRQETIVQGLQKGWVILFTRCTNGLISGTIASRPLGTCHFQFKQKGEFLRSKCPNLGYIDFFCIRPDFQKTGLGSTLLHWIDSSTSKMNRFVHLFQKELTPLHSLPPLWKGTYIVREVIVHISNPKITLVSLRTLPPQLTSSFSIMCIPEHKAFLSDTKIFKYNCRTFTIYVAITDTFHKADVGGPIGEVLLYRVEGDTIPSKKTIAAALEEVLETAGYNYILMDETIPHQAIRGWKQDAPYYMYCYNINPRIFFSCRPELLL